MYLEISEALIVPAIEALVPRCLAQPLRPPGLRKRLRRPPPGIFGDEHIDVDRMPSPDLAV
jgi:hypothetical protein